MNTTTTSPEYEVITGSGIVVAEADTHLAALRLVDGCYRLDPAQGPFTCRPIRHEAPVASHKGHGFFHRLFAS